MNRRFLFRVDAGPGIGLGHLQRCLALAERLVERGADATFLAPAAGDVRERVEAAGCRLEPLDVDLAAAGGDRDLAQLMARAKGHAADMLVVDSYAVSAAYLQALCAAGYRVVRLDDFGGEPVPAHIVINAGAHAAELSYRPAWSGTRLLLGPAFALLRSEFADLPNSAASSDVREVLVAAGGADAQEVTASLVEGLDRSAGEFSVHVLVGPFAASPSGVDAAAGRSRRTVRWSSVSAGIAALMRGADLAISAAGQTTYELAACGTPTIAFQVANNQAPSLQALARAGIVKSAGDSRIPGLADRVLAALDELRLDRAERLRMGEAARRLVDGRGADRVADVLLAAA